MTETGAVGQAELIVVREPPSLNLYTDAVSALSGEIFPAKFSAKFRITS
jgi:hypothetical protein